MSTNNIAELFQNRSSPTLLELETFAQELTKSDRENMFFNEGRFHSKKQLYIAAMENLGNTGRMFNMHGDHVWNLGPTESGEGFTTRPQAVQVPPNQIWVLLTKKYKSGLVLMHTPAPPKTMQSKTHLYTNVISDIKNIFQRKSKLLKKYKIPPSKVWFDPGIGFGKNLQQNLSIMKNIKKFRIEKYGLLIGSSRKSWISGVDKSDVSQRLGGTIASVLYCLQRGVNIFRVHDVYETRQAIAIFQQIACSK